MGRVTNLITTAVLSLTVALVVLVGLFVYFRINAPEEVVVLPTQVILPTVTNTPEPVVLPTLPPAFTLTPTLTATPSITPSLTFTPSVSPTITDTPAASPTPEQTDTLTPSDTPTPTNTSSIPSATPTVTRSPFPFALRGGSVVFSQNSFNTQGCAYQGIGGQVLDTNGVGLNGIEVVAVLPDGSERRGRSGSASAYGPGGYEIPLDNTINNNTYVIQLRTLGAELSEPQFVTFPSNCDQNIALIYWSQTRPF